MADCKPSELTDVEFAMSVVADNAAAHHQYPSALRCFYQLAVVRFPVALPLLDIDSELSANVLSHPCHIGTCVESAYEGQRLSTLLLKVLHEPSLPLHGVLDSLGEVNTGLASWHSAHGAQVRQYGLLNRCLAQEEVTEWRVQRVCDLLGLPESRMRVAFFPALELLGPNAYRYRGLAHIETDTNPCPAKHRRIDKSVRVSHKTILRKQSVLKYF